VSGKAWKVIAVHAEPQCMETGKHDCAGTQSIEEDHWSDTLHKHFFWIKP
jgi:hypothetical protein